MIRALALGLALLLTACGTEPPAPRDTPGARLEQAAVQAGLIADPVTANLIGSWATGTDRLCIVRAGQGPLHIGALIDYGEGQGCAASGTVQRGRDAVAIAFGPCRFEARFDGERIVFPAELPAACDRFCTGRASLTALTAEHLSTAQSEAVTLRTPSGKPLCATDG